MNNRHSSTIVLRLLVFSVAGWLLASCSWLTSGGDDGKSERKHGILPHQKIRIVINSLGYTFPEGMNENNNPYLDYIKEGTNLDIDVVLPPIDAYHEMLNVIMTSGDLPDMINTSNSGFLSNYVKRDAIMPLDEYIDLYGPDLKRLIPQEAWEQVTFDGKIYAIPSLNEVMGTEIMYVRKDWLDNLGLEPPETLEEYVEVMKRFAESDPDGNDSLDTIGLSITENLGRTAPFFGAFGTQKSAWYERDGELVYSGILPETKEALAFLSGLYRDQLLDPEFPLNKTKTLEEKIISGKVGLFSAAWFDTRGPIEESRKSDPKAEWIPLEYPVGKDGHRGTYSTSLVRSYNVIPATSSNPEGVVTFLNFIAGEGHKTLKLGFENEVWIKRDGKMISNFAEHDRQKYRGIYGALCDTVELDVSKDRLDSLGEHFHLWDNIEKVHANLIKNQFESAPTPAMGKYNTKLQQLQDETFTKIVVGTLPLDEFDSFVERWKREGGNEITEEVNEWYKNK
ncbi:extracellular solute-binding protein [Paenibacillus sp. J2TS4]|uniref:extracellular solute-binding protein n=1 Tax=Paenibacillus sp. J2TS4 TaxID=2807194 RepID=UPI001B075DF0|nr:extracellular solute-binding protein [Paenibacillus sp. J2TS4]GIP31603.1 putative ABC transporter peptide-binding protein YtcQ [Paenibacillus sp. J2TS4]